ncbi:hypothetical protein M514_26857 [Trichuris suis]|uniref:Uncharacterized protein n=1 Tax=Trichuris suis TaxID=68888 RepID=A0A085MUR3_9BILA|nr:hypothetical protein M514_26857 [Trichuris suis]KHJ40115.1 hypothetical protein D918_09843 [Trichuris suis]
MIYRDATSRLSTSTGETETFPVTVGVHQGSAVSPLLFITVMDRVTRDLQMPYPHTMLYADDVVLMAESQQELEEKVITWKNHLALYGLKLNVRKTEYMEFGSQTPGTISVHELLTKALTFKYLGSYLSYEGGVTTDVSAKMQTAWRKWKTLTGVLCDKKLPRKLKSKVYRTVIRPAVLYGSECWAIAKKDEQRLSVMETTMLRRTIGIRKLEHTPTKR